MTVTHSLQVAAQCIKCLVAIHQGYFELVKNTLIITRIFLQGRDNEWTRFLGRNRASNHGT